jgi:cytidylate kinase
LDDPVPRVVRARIRMNPSSTYDKCLSYIDCHLHPSKAPTRVPARQPRPPAITISRETGAGGHSVAERLAERLRRWQKPTDCPWTVFDKNLVTRVLEDHDLPQRLAQFMPEDRVSFIGDTLEEMLGLHPSSWKLIHQTAETILHLAELGNVILVGRGANVITRQLDHVIHVRLVGSIERRCERIQATHKVGPAAARAFIRKEDAARKRFGRKYFDSDIEDPLLYHLILNTDGLTLDEAADLIARLVVEKFGLTTP